MLSAAIRSGMCMHRSAAVERLYPKEESTSKMPKIFITIATKLTGVRVAHSLHGRRLSANVAEVGQFYAAPFPPSNFRL